MEKVLLAHGSGGIETARLIREVFAPYLGNEILEAGEDGGVIDLPSGKIVTSTDGFSVSPLFFPGGNIGKLAICGSANDVAMMGAKPKYITCSFMIEEGFEIAKLRTILASMGEELKKGGIKMLSGDTKVIPRGGVDGLFITTTAFGSTENPLSLSKLCEGDAIIASGAVGTHGAVIYASREEMQLKSALESDCAQLWEVVEPLLEADLKIKTMRDATRGGLAAVLNEWAEHQKLGILLKEEAIPVRDEVRGICEILGFEPYNLANEGMCVIALPKENASKALEILHSFELTRESSLIGEVIGEYKGRVVLESAWKSRRFLEYPSGELLPRIC